MAKNIYGVQKVKEPEVRDGLDIGKATASATAQGAQLGAKFGPGGAILGGGFMGAYSLANQLRMQQQEKKALDDAEIANEFADNLEGRSLREDVMVQAQARYGMDSNNRYETAEIEGDGSGSADGIGEIHVDKDYNIKNIARGGEKHEDGGFKINNLEKEDVIFPTQDDEGEFNRVLGAINRWKLKRDPRAKKFLDRTRDRLPTDEDYGYDTPEYPKGKGQRKSDKEFNKQVKQLIKDVKQKQKEKEAFEKKFPGIDYEWYLSKGKKMDGSYDSPDGTMDGAWAAEKDDWEEAKFREFMNSTPEQKQVMIESGKIPKSVAEDPKKVEKWVNLADAQLSNKGTNRGYPISREDYFKDLGTGATIVDDAGIEIPEGMKFDPNTGGFVPIDAKTAIDAPEVPIQKIDSPIDVVQGVTPGANVDKQTKQGQKLVKKTGGDDSEGKRYIYRDDEPNLFTGSRFVTGDYSNVSDEEPSDNTDDSNDGYFFPYADVEDEVTADEYANMEYAADVEKREKERLEAEKRAKELEAQKTWDEIAKMENYNNPGKYTSAINKGVQGSKPIEDVERRFITSDKYKYEDMSAKARQENIENRNFQNRIMKGKGLTAGQKQSYGSQNAADYYDRAEKINAAENERRYKISNANVDLTNRDKSKNLDLANQYDSIVRKQKAVQQRYKDASASDWAKLSQLEEQKRYMMNKDRKMFLRDKATLPFLGTKNMQVTPEGVKYIVGEDGQKYYAK